VEGVVIVGSILLAFGLQAWWDGVQEREQERDALERLDVEFAAVDSVLVEWQANHHGVGEASEELLAHTGPGGSDALSRDSIAALIWTMTAVWTLDPPRATLSSLESSGRLGTLLSQDLLAQLASWQALLADLQGDEESVAKRVHDDLYPYLNSHVAWRTIISSDKGLYAVDPSSFPNGFVEVLASREFENLLSQRRIDMLNTVGNYDAVRASLAEVRSLIERELAR